MPPRHSLISPSGKICRLSGGIWGFDFGGLRSLFSGCGFIRQPDYAETYGATGSLIRQPPAANNNSAQQFRQEGRQGAIIQLLEIRHKRIPSGLREAVAAVSDERHLAPLLLAAAHSNSLEKFAEKL